MDPGVNLARWAAERELREHGALTDELNEEQMIEVWDYATEEDEDGRLVVNYERAEKMALVNEMTAGEVEDWFRMFWEVT